jgi:hypothetical protein
MSNKVFACELEDGDVTAFGTVSYVERIEGSIERIRIHFKDNGQQIVKATALYEVLTLD